MIRQMAVSGCHTKSYFRAPRPGTARRAGGIPGFSRPATGAPVGRWRRAHRSRPAGVAAFPTIRRVVGRVFTSLSATSPPQRPGRSRSGSARSQQSTGARHPQPPPRCGIAAPTPVLVTAPPGLVKLLRAFPSGSPQARLYGLPPLGWHVHSDRRSRASPPTGPRNGAVPPAARRPATTRQSAHPPRIGIAGSVRHYYDLRPFLRIRPTARPAEHNPSVGTRRANVLGDFDSRGKPIAAHTTTATPADRGGPARPSDPSRRPAGDPNRLTGGRCGEMVRAIRVRSPSRQACA